VTQEMLEREIAKVKKAKAEQMKRVIGFGVA
jgi:hypothetical protein